MDYTQLTERQRDILTQAALDDQKGLAERALAAAQRNPEWNADALRSKYWERMRSALDPSQPAGYNPGLVQAAVSEFQRAGLKGISPNDIHQITPKAVAPAGSQDELYAMYRQELAAASNYADRVALIRKYAVFGLQIDPKDAKGGY